MLVLTRRVNERVMVGDDIVITVLEIRGDQVRIGIDAPTSIAVHREEVFLELAAADREAAEVLEKLHPPSADGDSFGSPGLA
jgi:carbon storage regulator